METKIKNGRGFVGGDTTNNSDVGNTVIRQARQETSFPKSVPVANDAGVSDPADVKLLRLSQIIGDPWAIPPLPPLIPVRKSTWWAGVRAGRFPKPVKITNRISAWPATEIHELIKSLPRRK